MSEQSGVLLSELVDLSGIGLDRLRDVDDASVTRCVGAVVRGSLVEMTQAVTEVDESGS
jgi:hypothetical protein